MSKWNDDDDDDCFAFITACASNCKSCINEGAGKCDGPRCEIGFVINSQLTCDGEYHIHTWERSLVALQIFCTDYYQFIYLFKISIIFLIIEYVN